MLFPAGDEPVWAKQMNRDWWAPEVHIMPDGSYVAYYVTRNNGGVLSIGVAVSASQSMAGPWVDIGQPLIASKPDGQIGAFSAGVGGGRCGGRRGGRMTLKDATAAGEAPHLPAVTAAVLRLESPKAAAYATGPFKPLSSETAATRSTSPLSAIARAHL